MANTQADLGGALAVLTATIAERAANAGQDTSYTAKLLAAGPPRIAKKLGEEGVEAALAVTAGDKAHLIAESGDLLYHLAVAWVALGIGPDEIAAELTRRQGTSGLAEKASRGS